MEQSTLSNVGDGKVHWRYELVEIQTALMDEAADGKLEMRMEIHLE
jgi:hypothetical protein